MFHVLCALDFIGCIGMALSVDIDFGQGHRLTSMSTRRETTTMKCSKLVQEDSTNETGNAMMVSAISHASVAGGGGTGGVADCVVADVLPGREIVVARPTASATKPGAVADCRLVVSF